MKKVVFTMFLAFCLVGIASSCAKEDVSIEQDEYAIENGEIEDDDI